MCGISGIYSFSGGALSSEQEQALLVMKDFMHHRGPDASAYKKTAQVGLVHTRLSIVDLDERSTQPMESQNWVISFNGEIINYLAIRKELKSKHQFRTHSDTEVLLLALEEWGLDKTLEKCAGMFAFLAYNKATKILYAARDRLGIKPLYYYPEQDRAIWFASTPATIVAAHPTVEWRENKQAIGSFFALGAPFTKESTISKIQQIPPACVLTVLPDQTYALHRYWEPEYQEQFTMHDLIDIVQEYGMSDVKSALFMSGGIDSTFLGSILTNMDFFHLDSPERHYAKKVAKTYKRPLEIVRPKPETYMEGLKKICATYGEPLMSGGIPYTVSYEVAQKNYKMAISANGADELFFGYPRTPMIGYNIELPAYEESSNQWLSEQIAHIFRDKRSFDIPEYQEWIPSLIDIGMATLKKCNLTNFPPCASYRWLEIMTYVVNDLNPTLDGASMANSLEVRVPFLDHRIVQGVLSWPADMICTRELGRKSPLKQHLLKDFSKAFLTRPKLGFSIDEHILSNIKSLSDKAFKTSEDNAFIQLKDGKHSKYLDRDRIYLKSMIHAYSSWKESGPIPSQLTNFKRGRTNESIEIA